MSNPFKLLINNEILLLASLIPLSLILGPLIAEINIFFIILFFLYKKFKTKQFDFLHSRISYLFYILIFFHIIGFILFNFDEISLAKSFFYIRFLFLMLCVNYLLNINEQVFIQFTFYIIYICFLLLIIFGFIQFLEILIFTNSNNDSLIFSKSSWRISSFFFDEYILGSYFIRILPIFFLCYFFLEKKLSYKLKNYFYVIIFLIHLFIILSSERTSIFMIIIFDILFLILIKNEKKLKSLIILFYFLCSLFLFIFPNFFPKIEQRLIFDIIGQNGLNIVKIKNMKKDYSFSNIKFQINDIKFFTDVRQKHAEVALKMFNDSPLIGHGIKSFSIKCNDKKYFAGYAGTESSCTTHPHNYYLQFLSETGLIIFLIIFLIFINILLEIFKCFKNKDDNNVKQVLLISFFIHLFPFVPSGSFFNNWLSVAFFWSAGFLLHFYPKFK